MIAKVIPAKAGGRTFGGLVDYMTAENRLERSIYGNASIIATLACSNLSEMQYRRTFWLIAASAP